MSDQAKSSPKRRSKGKAEPKPGWLLKNRLWVMAGAVATALFAVYLVMTSPKAEAEEAPVLEEVSTPVEQEEGRGFFQRMVDEAIARTNEDAAQRLEDLEDLGTELNRRESDLKAKEAEVELRLSQAQDIIIGLNECSQMVWQEVRNVISVPSEG